MHKGNVTFVINANLAARVLFSVKRAYFWGMTSVNLIVYPATEQHLKDGAYILFPHNDFHALCLVIQMGKNWMYKYDGQLHPLPSFFPSNCFVPASL